MRKNLSCNSSIEKAYLSTGYESICFHCGADDTINADSEIFYPICNRCLHDKKEKVKQCRSRSKENK